MRKVALKKGMSTLLAAAVTASMVTGCGGGSTGGSESGNGAAAETSAAESGETAEAVDTESAGEEAAASGSYTDYSGGFPENVTIQIPVYDRAFEGWDVTNNYYTQWIQSEFGDKYNVTVEYVAINRTNEVQDFMQLIAAGTAPDIIFHYDMPQAVNYYGQGAMQDLDLAEIAYYAPTYYANMADTIAKYGTLDGKNTFFFAGRDAIYYNYVTLIRQDWLDAVGEEMPTNRAELDEVARKWKEAGLGTIGDSLKVGSFTMEYPFFDGSATTEEYAQYLDLNVAPLTWKPTEDLLRAMNAEYNEGILDQEFYLNTDDASWKADFVAGNIGTYSFYINSSTDAISSLLANDPNAVVATMNPGAWSVTGNNYYYEYPAYGMIMGMNSASTAEERAAVWMLLDWMSQPENLFYLQNGVEGENYTLEDGIAVPVEGFSGESKLSQNNNKDYWCLIAEVATYGDEESNYKANLRNLAPVGYETLIEDSYNYAKANTEYGVITPIFKKAVEATGEYSSDLNALWQEACTALVTCAPEEFDSMYEQYSQDYLDAGYQEILDEKAGLYAEGNYIAE